MSNPGRQSLMLLNLSRGTDLDTECTAQRKEECASSLPDRITSKSSSTSGSPIQTKQKFGVSLRSVTQTLMQNNPNYRVKTSCVLTNKWNKSTPISDGFNKDKMDLIYYFKSPCIDKMSDYEDIWEKTPGLESPRCLGLEEMISPTQSEKKFKEFLFNKFLDGNCSEKKNDESYQSSVTDTEESIDFDYAESPSSYPECPSSISNSFSILSLTCSNSSDNKSDTSEFSDPLHALEALSDNESLSDLDDLSFFVRDQESELSQFIEQDQAVEINNSSHDTSTSLCDSREEFIHSTDGDIGQSKASSSVGGILRKLSIRRKSSIKKQEKRLSAVIGCYMTPSLLSRKVDEGCQVDSSSWEFLDQNEQPGRECFKEINKQVKRNSLAIEIEPSCLKTHQCDKKSFDDNFEENLCSTFERLYDANHEKPEAIFVPHNESKSSDILKAYIEDLSKKEDSLLGQTVMQFIKCTKESAVNDPILVMRNMRQLMNGLKNYLIITGEGELFILLKLEREKLLHDQFLDLDSIMEDVMQKLIVRPLRKYLEVIFFEEFTQSGCLQLLSKNITYALSLSHKDLNIPQDFVENLSSLVDIGRNTLTKMREAFSPSDKLECFLELINHIRQSASPYTTITVSNMCSILCYLIIHTNWDSMEIECEYMWGLLPPTALSKEGGYYLSILSCALHWIKNLCLKNTPIQDSIKFLGKTLPSFLTIFVPDTDTNLLSQFTLPTRPGGTVRELLMSLREMLRCQGDFALFKCKAEKESLVLEDQKVSNLLEEYSDERLVFKRRNLQIILP